jgi:hypothetical protein
MRFSTAPPPKPLPAESSGSSSGAATAADMLTANGWTESVKQGREDWLRALPHYVGDADPAVLVDAVRLLRDEFEADLPALLAEVGAGYARLDSQSDLAAAVTYYQTPAGRAFQGNRVEIARIFAAISANHIRSSLLEARAHICASATACGIPQPSAGWGPVVLPAAAPINPKQLAMAREILLIDEATSGLSRLEQKTLQQIGGHLFLDETSLAAFKVAFLAAAERNRQRAIDDGAARYAGLFTEQQLLTILEFKRGPIWRRLQLHRDEIETLGRTISETHALVAQASAGHKFCQTHDCGSVPPSGDVADVSLNRLQSKPDISDGRASP